MSFEVKEYYNQHLKDKITFYIGKNALGNFDIIDKSKSNDIWFHIDDKPSAHVIALIPDKINKKDLRYIIKQGAVLCKQESKYKSVNDINIVYTTINNISKTDTIGSVITTNQKYIKI